MGTSKCFCENEERKQNKNIGNKNITDNKVSKEEYQLEDNTKGEEYPEKTNYKDNDKDIHEQKEKELKEKQKKIKEEREKLEKEKEKFSKKKKEFEKEQKLEIENKRIEEEKAKLEEEKRKIEFDKKFNNARQQIEKGKKEINEMRRKLEEDKKKEIEEKKLKEEQIKLEEEKAKIEKEKKEEEMNKFVEEEKKKNRQSEEFYDMILYFNSFEQLKKDGWDAKFTKFGKKKYDKCINEKNIIIGVVGNKNRGKSYLLGRIMKMKEYENPHGFLVTTSGISSIFPKLANKDKTFITLDTAGRDNPLLQNTFFEEKDKTELIRNIARDQKVTEIALNDFIIQESDVLITVLEQLSFNEQEMLKNLINQINNYGLKFIKKNKFTGKRLIVIHNLMNISTVEGINKFINEVLLKSLTFSLDIQENKKLRIKIFIQNLNHDKEKNSNRRPIIEIVHVIVGDDSNEEIKKNFNDPAFEFIRKNITTQIGKSFNILEKFKNFIIENSKNYFEGEAFDSNSLLIGTETQEDEKVVIPIELSPELKNKQIKFKKFYINARGIHNFSSAIEPKYSTDLIEIDGKKYIEIEFELSGDVTITEKSHVTDKEQYIFTIKGTTHNEGENSKKDFEFQPIINRFLPIKDEDNNIIKNRESEIIISKEGILTSNDEKYGIHNIKIPINLNEKITGFEDEENINK